MQETLNDVISVCKTFYKGLVALPMWAKVSGAVVAFLTHSVGILAVLTVLAMGIDVISRIWAEYIINDKKEVIESNKFKNKTRELIPFALGVIILRLMELALGHIKIPLVNLEINNLFSVLFCILCILREAISVLENGAAAGFPPAATMAKILKIQRKNIVKKASKED